jgi:hypothetical protein
VKQRVRDAGVAGSNPATPTNLSRFSRFFLDFVIVVSFENNAKIRCFERDLNVPLVGKHAAVLQGGPAPQTAPHRGILCRIPHVFCRVRAISAWLSSPASGRTA